MAEKVGSIYYDLDLDDKKFSKGAGSASKQLDGLERQFQLAEVGSLALLAGITALGVGLLGLAQKALGTTAQLETARAGFITLLGSAEKADATMARIKKEAAATPFEIPGLTKATQAIALVTKDGNKAVDIILDVGKALAAAGKGQVELDRIIANLQQMALTGKVTEMDIRQFGTNGINILELLAKHFKTTTARISDMQGAGKIGFKDIVAALKEAGTAGGQFANAFSNASGTYDQSISNLNDSFNILISDILVSSGAFDLIKKAVEQATKLVSAFGEEINKAGGFTKYVNKIFKENEQTIYIVAGAIIGALVPAFYSLATSIGSVMLALSPFLIAGAAIGAIIYLLVQAFGGIEPMMQAFQNALNQIWVIVAPVLLPALQDLWNTFVTQLLPALRELWAILEPILLPVLKVLAVLLGAGLLVSILALVAGLKLLILILTGLANIVRMVVEDGANRFNNLKNEWAKFTDDFNKRIEGAKEGIRGLVQRFAKLADDIREALKGVFDAITKPFREAFGEIEQKTGEAKKNLARLDPNKRNSPSLVDYISKGTRDITNLYDGMFNDLGEMSNKNKIGFMSSAQGLSQATQNGKESIAAPATTVVLNPQGIIARSRGELRDIAKDLIGTINDELRAKGRPQIAI